MTLSLPSVACSTRHDHLVVPHLRVAHDVGDLVDRRGEHVGGDEPLEQIVAVERRATLGDEALELVLVREPLLDDVEARVLVPLDVERAAEVPEELLRRTRDDDSLAVAARPHARRREVLAAVARARRDLAGERSTRRARSPARG